MMIEFPEFQAQQLRIKTHQPKVGLPGVAWQHWPVTFNEILNMTVDMKGT